MQLRLNLPSFDPDPLDSVLGDAVIAAVIELGRTRTGVVRHFLCHLQTAVVEQERGDPCATKRVIADPRHNARSDRPSSDHQVSIVP